MNIKWSVRTKRCGLERELLQVRWAEEEGGGEAMRRRSYINRHPAVASEGTDDLGPDDLLALAESRQGDQRDLLLEH